MHQLATIQLNINDNSQDVGLFVADILEWAVAPGGTGSIVKFRNGRTDLHVSETPTQVQAAINALWDESNAHGGDKLDLTDGVTAPGAGSGVARIYVDTADGDLKVIFADGVTKTLATDT